MIRFTPRCVGFISLDRFIYSELGDGGFGEHAVPAPCTAALGFLPVR